MANPVQTVVQHLNRAKAAFLKGDTLRPLVSLAEALKIVVTTQISSQEMNRIATLLRETVANVAKMEEARAHLSEPLVYQPGGEKKVLAQLIPLVKAIHATRKSEGMDAVRERKLKIDHAIIHGSNAVAAGKFDEAKEYFREATNLYVDEHAMFLIIADRLQGAEAWKESFEYLRSALGVNPNDRKACDMVVAASEKIGNIDRGLTLLRKMGEKQGATAHMNYAMARLHAARKQWAEAEALARTAVEQDPDMVDAQKFLRKAAAKAGKAGQAAG